MVLPSSSDVALLAVTAVSIVSTLHTVLRPLIPDVQPLNCGFCLSMWLAIGFACWQRTPEAVCAIPVTGFFALIAVGLWPWAFYSTSE